MELRCMQSPTFSSIPRSVLFEKPFSCGQIVVKLPGNKRACPDARKLKFLDFRTRSSGITTIKAQSATTSDGGQKDGNLVFVAGATGKVGSRTVRELLNLGFNVRAGVRSIQRAEPLVQSVKNLKLDDVTQPIDKLELVECDLEQLDRIRPALANSSVVICCIGASEKEVFDITGPYRIDYQATKNLIDAATSAKVEHFILVTSLGTNKVGFPAAILNLFWGVLIWKRKAEESLLASGLPYTIVRPGGMERPTDSFKETHNLTLSEEDTLFGGLVSNLQVAELLAFMAKNRGVSCCKVVEVVAETSAPLTPMGELLNKIPSQRPDICGFKEPDEADGSQPIVLDTTPPTVEEPKLSEEEPKKIKTTKATPLSPYTAYEDLKPPTSPIPTKASKIEITPTVTTPASIEVNSSETLEEKVIIETAPVKAYVLSPYTNYEDLKPPTSPTPTPSGSEKEPSIAPATSVDTIPEKPADEKPESHSEPKARPLSPYAMYEDLKPPSSPTPCAK